MKFFFPDSQDQIDPTFDFVTEEHAIHRVRQRDDLYAHEALGRKTYDGILVSKTIVDGTTGTSGKYTQAQRHRLYREGVRRFFRLDSGNGSQLLSMGDCGGFSYVKDDIPPYTPDEVIDFYEECGFDIGISVDHVILGYDADADHQLIDDYETAWSDRQKLTLDLADQFLSRCRTRQTRVQPAGVAQGWSPLSYASAVEQLQQMGYRRIALGGMVPLKTPDILACLKAIDDVRHDDTQLHLLGITRHETIDQFATLGVTSFDSTAPFRQAFKDDRDNYYAVDRTYTAIRVPQVDGNPKLKARIRAGQLDQRELLDLERSCRRLLRAYDQDGQSLGRVLEALARYTERFDPRVDRTAAYKELLEDRPWKTCPCGICGKDGIDVAIFRGSERNKRRGFHNVYVFSQRLERQLAAATTN